MKRKAFNGKLKQLSDVPFKELGQSASKQEYLDFCSKYSLANYEWFAPQLMAHVSSWERDTEYILDQPLAHFVLNCPRGGFVKTQKDVPGSYYCSLVPFIWAAFKKYHGIKYSSWKDHALLEPWLREMLEDDVSGITKEDILRDRAEGLIIRSGPNAGKSRAPTSAVFLYGIGDTKLGQLGWLSQVALSQIWVAHPSIRNEYMILDHNKLDSMPAPLIGDIFVK